jgi:predicted chitinase
MFFTHANLKVIMPNAAASDIQTYTEPLNQVLKDFEINTPTRAAAFIAQVAHESGQLLYKEEIASGDAYEGRMDLGNTQPGDGRRYKGRGLIQLTGRANYRQAGQAMNLPLEQTPDRVVQDPYTNVAVAGWYWKSRNINSAADAGDFEKVTRLINGGLNGYDDRCHFWQRAKEALKNAPSVASAQGAASNGTPNAATGGPATLHIIAATPVKPQPAMSKDLIKQGIVLKTLSPGNYGVKRYQEIQGHYFVEWDDPALIQEAGSNQAYIYVDHADIHPASQSTASMPSSGQLNQMTQALDINNSQHTQAAAILCKNLPQTVLQQLETQLDPQILSQVMGVLNGGTSGTAMPTTTVPAAMLSPDKIPDYRKTALRQLLTFLKQQPQEHEADGWIDNGIRQLSKLPARPHDRPIYAGIYGKRPNLETLADYRPMAIGRLRDLLLRQPDLNHIDNGLDNLLRQFTGTAPRNAIMPPYLNLIDMSPAATNQGTPILEVPYYSQRDNYTMPMRTCNSSSCAMAAKFLGADISGDDEYLETVLRFGDTTDHGAQTQALETYGIKSSFHNNLSYDDLNKSLGDRKPIVIGILHRGSLSAPTGGHMLVVIGKYEGGYIVNDPFGSLNDGYQDSSRGAREKYSFKELDARWLPEGPNSGWGRLFT